MLRVYIGIKLEGTYYYTVFSIACGGIRNDPAFFALTARGLGRAV
jgi:hypothetical protein